MRVTAGFWRRFFADFLDYIFLSIFLGIVIALVSPSTLENNPLLQNGSYLLGFLYFPLFEASRWQATPGQWCVRMRICTLTFERISFGRAFLRECLKFLLAIPLVIAILILSLIFFLILKQFLQLELSLLITACLLYIMIFVSSLCLYYVRFFNKRQQTARDYVSKSMMMVVEKPAIKE